MAWAFSGTWEAESSGPYIGTLSIVNHTDDVTLAFADFNKEHIMTAATAKVFTLPAATAGMIGKWLVLRKAGAGNLTLTPDGSDTMNGDSTLVSNDATQTYANIRLVVEAAGSWGVRPLMGDWI